ncbi:MAG: hypothetical protein KAW12_07035 [Candidatus Aminicenantes bacterium]|nr:hypothetical protein [Candidatus Aminicenantes bacterium]
MAEFFENEEYLIPFHLINGLRKRINSRTKTKITAVYMMGSDDPFVIPDRAIIQEYKEWLAKREES